VYCGCVRFEFPPSFSGVSKTGGSAGQKGDVSGESRDTQLKWSESGESVKVSEMANDRKCPQENGVDQGERKNGGTTV
jgi:hypothetical protein